VIHAFRIIAFSEDPEIDHQNTSYIHGFDSNYYC